MAIVSKVDDDISAQGVRLMDVALDISVTAQKARAYQPDPRPFELAVSL